VQTQVFTSRGVSRSLASATSVVTYKSLNHKVLLMSKQRGNDANPAPRATAMPARWFKGERKKQETRGLRKKEEQKERDKKGTARRAPSKVKRVG